MTVLNNHLPDIMSDATPSEVQKLNWVGMEKIAVPVQFPVNGTHPVGVNAFVDAFVSLDSQDEGIHMSRLYLILNDMLANKLVDMHQLNGLLESMLNSQNGNSHNARIRLTFDLPLNKPALLSEFSGFQAYPVCIDHQLIAGKVQTQLELTIPYSSTCPCSASLAKQLISQQINERFNNELISKEEMMVWLLSKETKLATPHNQRSYAYVNLTLKANQWADIPTLIFDLEAAIGTPVQTAVKREDEQAFAKLNGDNLMFCEDAARKLDNFLTNLNILQTFSFKVEHQESLHAHNAVVIHSK